MKKIISIIALVAILFSLTACGGRHDTEVETYTEGYEITHMNMVNKKAFISFCNDFDSFTLGVDYKTYARYLEGDICEIEVRVMEESNGNYYNEYTILGYEK